MGLVFFGITQLLCRKALYSTAYPSNVIWLTGGDDTLTQTTKMVIFYHQQALIAVKNRYFQLKDDNVARPACLRDFVRL